MLDRSVLPIEGHWEVVLSLNADVRIPLVQGLHVFLKHPLIPSGNTVETEQVSKQVVQEDEQGRVMSHLKQVTSTLQ